jgi:hypothetical protein
MVNYCIDYVYQDGSYVDYGTTIEDSEESREEVLKGMRNNPSYKVDSVYENEDCYCHAYDEGECACGNFK